MATRSGIVEETGPHARLMVYPSPVRTALPGVTIAALGMWALMAGVIGRETGLLLIGAVVVALGLLSAGLGLQRLLSTPDPVLTVDADGVRDHRIGLLPWWNVGEIRTVRLQYLKYVVVQARDPQVFLDSGVAEPRRARSNLRWLGGPIAVPSFQIPGSARQLVMRIERHRP